MSEFGKECVGGVLIAESFSRTVIRSANIERIHLVKYSLNLDWNKPKTFDEIKSSLALE